MMLDECSEPERDDDIFMSGAIELRTHRSRNVPCLTAFG